MSNIDLVRLGDPFPSNDIEWRVGQAGSSGSGKPWVKPLAYITARACMDRLDEVCGPENWNDRYEVLEGVTSGVLCRLSIQTNPDTEEDFSGWTTKMDGAEFTDIEPFKGGLSGAFKRACVKWGIGRYLYNLESSFADTSVEKPKDLKGWHFHQKGELKFWWKEPVLPEWALPSSKQVAKESPKTLVSEDGGMAKATQTASPPEQHQKKGHAPVSTTEDPFLEPWKDEPFVDGTRFFGKKFGDLDFQHRSEYLDRLLTGVNNLERQKKPVDDEIKKMSIKLGKSVDRHISWNGVSI